MEDNRKTCSFKDHHTIDAISYCYICRIYMCNKCEIFHSKMFETHNSINLDNYNKGFFTGYCKEENHPFELEYFCKTHKQLCCAKCVIKIGNKKDAIHKNCNVCSIEEIKDEKINKLNENIKKLEELSKYLNDEIKNLKNIFEKINNKKEEIKLDIQKIFTKIKSEINYREDQLLDEVDNLFDKNFIKENNVKEFEKFPNKVKFSLEQCKNINLENDKLNSLINDCLNIEKDIKTIDEIKENINYFKNANKLNIEFSCDINNLSEKIKVFGKIIKNNEELNELSNIIKNDINKQNHIINWILEKINKDDIEFKIIFRMNENNYKSEDFHKACDNQGPTLVLIKTKTQRTFGGFTPLNWNKTGGAIKDESNQTFIFSLDNYKKFNILKIKEQAINNSNDGPKFGDCDIKLESNMKNGVSFANNNCNFLSGNNLELTGGKGESEKFETLELEVFKVIY